MNVRIKSKLKGVRGSRTHIKFEIIKEEHCAFTLWPGGVFAGHVAHKSGKARDMVEDPSNSVKEREEGAHACFGRLF